MDKQQKDYGYITRYKMGGTTYEVEMTFSGTEIKIPQDYF